MPTKPQPSEKLPTPLVSPEQWSDAEVAGILRAYVHVSDDFRQAWGTYGCDALEQAIQRLDKQTSNESTTK